MGFIFWGLIAGCAYLAYLVFVDSNESPKSKNSSTSKIKDHGHHGERCFDVSTKGEDELLGILEKGLDPKEYYIFNNIIIPAQGGKTTEIDHLVISNHGIFVIENKDWAGYLFGSSHGETWTQSLRGGKKNHYRNPLHQNYGHVKSLEKLLPFVDPKKFFSVAAFSRRGDFKTSMPPHVFYYDHIVPYIKNEKGRTISTQRVLMTIGQVSKVCQVPPANLREHVENIKNGQD